MGKARRASFRKKQEKWAEIDEREQRRRGEEVKLLGIFDMRGFAPLASAGRRDCSRAGGGLGARLHYHDPAFEIQTDGAMESLVVAGSHHRFSAFAAGGRPFAI